MSARYGHRSSALAEVAIKSGDSSTASGATSPVVIRPYDSGDRAAIREICRQAASEQPDPIFHEDLELAPLLLADYYLDYEPEQCFVAQVNGRVVGYMLASKNTEDCLRVLNRRILPRLALRLLWKLITLQFRKRSTYKALWWKLVSRLGTHQGDKLLLPINDYPAHTHRNVERASRRKGIGYALSVKQHGHLLEQGIKGMHAVVVESASNDDLSRELRRRLGYELVATQPHPVLSKVTGQDYFLKLLVCDLEKEARNAASAAARVSDPNR